MSKRYDPWRPSRCYRVPSRVRCPGCGKKFNDATVRWIVPWHGRTVCGRCKTRVEDYMLLSKMRTDAKRFQFREKPFSTNTVDAIVETGIDEARFDPIPVVIEDGRGIVAGDGHSRFEAVRRLAALDRLPESWRARSPDPEVSAWNIPTRAVQMDDALRLAYVANMSRDPFTPCEEAKIFQARIERGESVKDIAASSHRSVGYVSKRLFLNGLCRTIKEAVGQPWGIDTDKAIVLAECFERNGIGHQLQQQLWYKVISQGDWTQRSIKLFMDRLARKMSDQPQPDGMLFELSPDIGEAVKAVTGNAQNRQRARRGLQWLMRRSRRSASSRTNLSSLASGSKGPGANYDTGDT